MSLETGLRTVWPLVAVIAISCGEVKESTIDSGTPPEFDARSSDIDAAIPPGCTNDTKDGTESDVDCGGDECPRCANDRDCGSANDCQSGVCTGGKCRPCEVHGDCNEISGRFCDDGGVCRDKRADGASCGDPAQCVSNYCMDDVCCNEPCDEICAACSTELTGLTNGECWGIPVGTDTGECPGVAFCDGNRACYCPCTGETCGDHGFECGTLGCMSTDTECAADTSGCGTSDTPWFGWEDVITSGPSDNTVTLLAIDELTGECANNGGGGSTYTELRVGDGGILPGPPAFEFRQQSGLTFDLSSLPPGAKIVTATLAIYQSSVEGTVYTGEMSKVVLEHVRYNTIPFGLCAATPITVPFTTRDVSTNATLGWKYVNIADQVRYALATCQARVSMRLTFWPSNGLNDAADNRAHFVSDNVTVNYPYLTIVYH